MKGEKEILVEKNKALYVGERVEERKEGEKDLNKDIRRCREKDKKDGKTE